MTKAGEKKNVEISTKQKEEKNNDTNNNAVE